MTSKTSPKPKTSKDVTCRSPGPVMRSTMQNKTEQQRKHIRWSHAKQFCGYFPSLQIPVCFRGVTGKIKEISFPTVSVKFLFFLFCPHWEIQSSISQWDSRQDMPPEIFSKCTPRHLRESGHFPLLATLCPCFYYIPAAIESQSGTVPRMVSRIAIQSTNKRIKSKWMIGLESLLWYGDWTARSRVNSHHMCWGQWSMHWYRSSRQAVGWSTYFFPPESDCFCWRPVDKKGNRGEKEKRVSKDRFSTHGSSDYSAQMAR